MLFEVRYKLAIPGFKDEMQGGMVVEAYSAEQAKDYAIRNLEGDYSEDTTILSCIVSEREED